VIVVCFFHGDGSLVIVNISISISINISSILIT
jgi:hypothetical protein